MVSSTPRPHFTSGKDPVLILKEAGWAPGPVWTGGKSRPHRDSIPDRPARSQSLYRMSYWAHKPMLVFVQISSCVSDTRSGKPKHDIVIMGFVLCRQTVNKQQAVTEFFPKKKLFSVGGILCYSTTIFPNRIPGY